MDKILQIFYSIYKKVRPPKRLYRFGTIGLRVHDDRTIKEKFFDRIDDFFFDWQQRMRYKRAYRKQVWHSYFDVGLGKVVSSSEEIKAQEKKGYVYMSDAELDKYSAQKQAQNKKERRERTQKAMEEGFAKIRTGNSNYYQEFIRRHSK